MKGWAQVVGWLCIAALAWVVLPKFSSTREEGTVSAADVWDDLSLCSDLVSFDGKKTLSLDRNGGAMLDDRSGKDQLSKKGTWKAANTIGHYTVQFDHERANYERVAPEGSSLCILVAGTRFSANLQLSWFAVQEYDPPDYR